MKSSAVCIWRAFLKWVPNECINEAWPSLDGLHPRPRECDPRSRVHNHTYLSELPRCLHVRVFESHVVPHGRRGFSFIPHREFLIPLLFFFTLTRSKWTSPAYRPWVQTRLGRERALTARRARQNEHVTRRRARVSAEGPPKTPPEENSDKRGDYFGKQRLEFLRHLFNIVTVVAIHDTRALSSARADPSRPLSPLGADGAMSALGIAGSLASAAVKTGVNRTINQYQERRLESQSKVDWYVNVFARRVFPNAPIQVVTRRGRAWRVTHRDLTLPPGGRKPNPNWRDPKQRRVVTYVPCGTRDAQRT